jgi:branched-chain amino acid transport system permease protein
MGSYDLNVLVTGLLAAISVLSLNVLIGQTGIFSGAAGVFYGVGAYTAAIVSLHWTSSLLVGVAASVVVGAIVGLILAIPAVRVIGDYFIVASLGFATILETVFAQWTQVTGGANGLSGIPLPTIFGYTIETPLAYVVVTVILLVIVAAVLWYFWRVAPVSRLMRAAKEDDIALIALGHKPARVRIVAVVVSGAVAGVSGAIYCYYIGFVDSNSFSTTESILFVTMLVFGGAVYFLGPIVGAIVITVVTAALALLPITPNITGPLQQVAVGLILILLMVFAPRGVSGIAASAGKSLADKYYHRGKRRELSPVMSEQELSSMPEDAS